MSRRSSRRSHNPSSRPSTRATSRSSTRAISALETAGADFRLLKYDVAEVDRSTVDRRLKSSSSTDDVDRDDTLGQRVASLLGLDPERVFKTLIVEIDGVPVTAIVPVDQTLDLKVFAQVTGGRRAHLVDPIDAERITGYVVGGISPVGQRRRLATYLHESAAGHDRILVNAGKRGVMIELSPSDLLTITGGTYVSMTRP